MKNMLCSILLITSIVHAPPHTNSDNLVELVTRFKAHPPNQMRKFLSELSAHGITAKCFIRFVATHKIESALRECQKEFKLTATHMREIIAPITTEYAEPGQIIYKCPFQLRYHLQTVRGIIECPPYHWPKGLTVHYGKVLVAQVVTECQPDESYSYELHLPHYFLRISKAAQMATLGHEHTHLIMHHHERTSIIEQRAMLIRQSNTEHKPAPPSQFQNNPLLKKKSSSIALNKLRRAQEHEADFLAILQARDPKMIAHGLRELLGNTLTDANYPKNPKRRNWTSKFANLLDAEKQREQERAYNHFVFPNN